MKKLFIQIVLCCFLAGLAIGQSCPTYTNSILINTGYDYPNTTTLAIGVNDPSWYFTWDNDPNSNDPGYAFTIPQNTVLASWATNSTSQWISIFPVTSNTYNGTYNVEYKFYLNSVTNPTLNINAAADDECDIYLNGNFLGQALGYASFTNILSSNTSFFNIGTNTLKVVLKNVGQGYMGLNIYGTLVSSANNILLPQCVNTGCYIQGIKYYDKNTNGVFNSGTDALVPNWPIYLTDGTNTFTTITNSNGNYVFNGIPAGTYTLGEPTFTNVTNVSPASGFYTLSLASGTIITNKDFANNFACCNFNSTVYVNGTPNSIPTSSPITVCKDQQINLAIANNCGFPYTMLNNFTWDMGDGNLLTGATVTHSYSSNGNYLVQLKNNSNICTTAVFTMTLSVTNCTVPTCDKCISSFAPSPGKYVVSLWAKEDHASPVSTYTGTGLEISFINDPTTYGPFIPDPSQNRIIDGWQRIEANFNVPPGATDLKIKLINNSSVDAYYDDIRIHPIDGNMKTYVYDPITLRLVAELDENNYATFYEYNEEGQLIRVKKETEKGVMTIKETRSSNRKN